MIHIVLITVALLVTLRQFGRSVGAGVAAVVFFQILLPIEVRIDMPGAIPELTAHRVLLLVLWWQVTKLTSPAESRLSCYGLFKAVTVMRLLSTLMAITLVGGIKEWLAFILESFLFCVLIHRGVRDLASAMRVLRGAGWALILIACVATLEKYKGVNLAADYIPGMVDYTNTVTATFRHRILFGYAMAMGFPIFAALWVFSQGTFRKAMALAGAALLPAACYFGNSRGPWAGLALGMGVMVLTSTPQVRKWMILLMIGGTVALATRPGVWETIRNRWEQTKTTDSHKGRSASYRLELWKVAYKQLSKAPHRFLFGFGGGSLEHMDLGSEFELGGSAGALGFTSWDSEYAADAMKYGFAGLLVELLLYLGLAKMAYSGLAGATPDHRVLLSASLAIILIYAWAMTNVAMFNPQLQFLFWTVVAIASRLATGDFIEPEPEPDSDTDAEPDLAPRAHRMPA